MAVNGKLHLPAPSIREELKCDSSFGPVGDQAGLVHLTTAPSFGVSEEDFTLRWHDYLAALKKFGELHGTCNVPADCLFELIDGSVVPLGMWLQIQRQRWKSGYLSTFEYSQLQAIVQSGQLSWDVVDLQALSSAENPSQHHNPEEAVRSKAGKKWLMFFDALVTVILHDLCTPP